MTTRSQQALFFLVFAYAVFRVFGNVVWTVARVGMHMDSISALSLAWSASTMFSLLMVFAVMYVRGQVESDDTRQRIR